MSNTQLKDGLARLTLGAALCWAAARATTLPRPGLTPEQGRELWERAVEQRGEGFPRKALASTEKLLASYPDNPIYLMFAADVLKTLGDGPREARALELFMQVAPFPTEACPRLGQIYRRLGQFDKALSAHRRCLDLDPTKSDLQLYVALELEQQERYEDAQIYFQRVLDKAPDYGDAVTGLARIKLGHGDAAGARALIDKLLLTQPENTDALMAAAHLDEKAGKLKEAQDKLLIAVKTSPSYPDLYRILGRVSLDLNDRKRAVEAYRVLHQLEPGNASVTRRLEELQQGQPK